MTASDNPRDERLASVTVLEPHAGSQAELAQRRRRSIVKRRRSLMMRYLVTADLLAFAIAFLIAEWVVGVGRPSWDNRVAYGTEFVVFFVTLPVWILIVRAYGLYRKDEERPDHSTADDIVPIFHVVTVGVFLFQGAAWLTTLATPKYPKLLIFWASAIVLVIFGRWLASNAWRRQPAYIQNALIVGTNDVALLIARKLHQHPEYGLNLVGFVDADGAPSQATPGRTPVLGKRDELERVLRERDVERVILAGDLDAPSALEVIHRSKQCDVQVDIVPKLFEVVGPGVDIYTIEGIPLMGIPSARLTRVARVTKRTIDVVVSFVALILLSPLFAFIAWRIHRDSPGPVFFRQTRLGLEMRELTMLKFRTMAVDTDENVHKSIMDKHVAPTDTGLFKLERTDEITSVGRWLRKTSLDELPQLLNVLRGDMSLVGPRPCLPYEVEQFAPHHFERFTVPAGITGLWQVTARARSTFVEALELDVAYARGWSLGLDLWLLVRTPSLAFGRGGSTA